jgi:hypothetical protein
VILLPVLSVLTFHIILDRALDYTIQSQPRQSFPWDDFRQFHIDRAFGLAE